MREVFSTRDKVVFILSWEDSIWVENFCIFLVYCIRGEIKLRNVQAYLNNFSYKEETNKIINVRSSSQNVKVLDFEIFVT